MEIYKPTFNENNEKARTRFQKVIEKHLVELKAAYDEYLNSDPEDKSDRRKIELEQYLTHGCGDKAFVYNSVTTAIHVAYPKPQKPAPEIAPTPTVPVVKSAAEAREKGYMSYAIIEDGPERDIPSAWKDPNIEWVGYSITEVPPTLGDRNNPARMTEDGKTYYRDF